MALEPFRLVLATYESQKRKPQYSTAKSQHGDDNPKRGRRITHEVLCVRWELLKR